MKKDKMDFHYLSSPALKDVAQKVYDLAVQVEKHHRRCCTPFLNPAELKVAADVAKLFDSLEVVCLAGSSRDERQLFCLYPAYDAPPQVQDEIALLRLQWDARFGELEHGDCLGTLLSLGLRRDILGDIRVGEGQAFVFVRRFAAEHIVSQLTKIGRKSVQVLQFPLSTVLPPMDEGKEAQVVLTSLRLDSFLAAAFQLSRTAAQKLIREGLVQLNHCVCNDPSSAMKEGDKVSLRRSGRALFCTILGKTGKDRYRVHIRLWKR